MHRGVWSFEERALVLPVLMLLALLFLSAAPASASGVSVPPGGVVRWPGESIVDCAAFGARWAPRDNACWYAVDLLQEPGPVVLERTTVAGLQRTAVEILDYPYTTQELTVAPGMVELAAEDQARVGKENARIRALWQLGGPARFTLPLARPLAGETRAKNFGSRRIFNNQPRSPHSGVDYSVGQGTGVLAVADGVVALAEAHFFAGNSVFLDHGDGLISMYFHLQTIDVQVGEEVSRGALIGTVGATGRATGPHLHYGLRWHGARIDPVILMGSVDAVPVVP